MQQRTLGRGLEVSAIGLGCMGMSQSYGPNPGDRKDMIALIRAAVDRGVTFFDTAEVYGPFVNEELVGEALAPLRDQVVIATKFGFAYDENGQSAGLSSRPEHIEQVADASLQAAAGRHDRPVLPAPGQPGGADRGRRRRGQGPHRRRQGAALRHVRGRRRHHPPRPRRPAGHRRAERVLAVVARPGGGGAGHLEELGIGLVPFSPLGKGFLTGTIDAPPRPSTAPTSAPPSPASTPRPARRTRLWSTCSAASRPPRRPRRRRSRWPGCWPRDRGSSRSPAPASWPGWRRTSPPPMSS